MEIGKLELELLGPLFKKAGEVKSIEEMISVVVIPLIGSLITVLLTTNELYELVNKIIHVGNKGKQILVGKIFDIHYSDYIKELIWYIVRAQFYEFFVILLVGEMLITSLFIEIRLEEISAVVFVLLILLSQVIFYGIRCIMLREKVIFRKVGAFVGLLYVESLMIGLVVQFMPTIDYIYKILWINMVILILYFYKLESDLTRSEFVKYKMLKFSKYIRYGILFFSICQFYYNHFSFDVLRLELYTLIWIFMIIMEQFYMNTHQIEQCAVVSLFTAYGRYDTKKRIMQYNNHKIEYELENGQKHIVDEAEVSKIIYQKKYMYRKKYGNVFVNLIQNEEKLKFDGYKIMNTWICFWKINDSCKEVVMLKAEDVRRIEVN